MSIILNESNWNEWEDSLLVQLQNSGLHYLFQKDPMEGVERTDVSGASQKQKHTKDQEAARSLLNMNLDKYHQSLVRDEDTLYGAYEVLKDICAPDPQDECYDEYKRLLKTPVQKGKSMKSNWAYFKTIHNRNFDQDATKEDRMKEQHVFRTFTWQLLKAYRAAILESRREKYTEAKTLELLEKVRISVESKGTDKKTKGDRPKVKCTNCEKKGHLAADCWSKRKTNSDQKAQLVNQDAQMYDDLHKRFGHVSDRRLRVINPSKTPPRPEDYRCEDCSQGKITKSHGQSSVSMAAEEPLDSVSIDVSGPHESGRNGHRWYAIVVDNFSRYKWLLPLRKKSEVQRALDEWRRGIELKMGKTIKRTRSDNAPELKQIFEEWKRLNGTETTYTLPDSSNQNGIAERAIRTVDEGVRTLLSETQLDGRYVVWDVNASKVRVSESVHFFENMQPKEPQQEELRSERKNSGGYELMEEQPPRSKQRIDEEDGTTQRAMIALSEPFMTLNHAILHPTESEGWRRAIDRELNTLTEFGTWRFVPKPEGCVPIDTRFVFAKKYDLDGKLEKYKARLVVRGFRQEYGVNFFESFAPTPGSATLRLFLASVCQYDLECHQIDACNAFAQSRLKEEVYVKLPANVECPDGMVAKLERCLYGLKQAAYQWNEDCTAHLRAMGFSKTITEPCLLFHEKRKMLVLLYVDDITIAAPNMKSIQWFKDEFSRKFKVKDLGETTQVIGVQVYRDRSRRRMWLNQEQYIQRMVDQSGFREHRKTSIRTPIGDWKDVEPAQEGEMILESTKYQSILGKIMYPALMTRPDIAFAVSSLAQASARPTPRHVEGLKRVLRYMRDTSKFSICYEARQGGMDIVGYSDADYANAKDRRSVSGMVFIGLGGAISWSSKKQATVATSTTEAEYIGLTPCAKEGIHLRRILNKIIGTFETKPEECQSLWLKKETLVFGDNQAAIKIAKALGVKKGTKHIDTQYHAVKQWVKEGLVKIGFVPTSSMAADGLTKPLGPQKMPEFRAMIGLRNPEAAWPQKPTYPELRESGGDVEANFPTSSR
ncbi:Retrovirus-related Pol polyprotein from transposon TNT 1-94 [Ceratocystis lukuohia]|uniref:Retrovirus-related Pol polyprotein from transposon TNT 1-94 n=1 Tax=Ceratocystis lukuohia TaxID=2019550 RepID=A0ABR4MBA7_9PEZI